MVAPSPIFSEKNWRPFSHHRLSAVSSAVTPLNLFIFSWKTDDLFWSSLSLLFISLGCHPCKVSSRTFFTCPTSFIHYSLWIQPQIFFVRMSPPGGCHPGRSAHPRPPLVTPLVNTTMTVHKCVTVHKTTHSSSDKFSSYHSDNSSQLRSFFGGERISLSFFDKNGALYGNRQSKKPV